MQLQLRFGGEVDHERRGGGIGGKAATGVRQTVGIGNIGLDIDDRSAIQQIHGAELQPQFATLATNAVQLDHRQTQRVGAEGGAGGKDSDPFVAAQARRTYRRVPALIHGLVKHEAEPQMGELLYAAQHVRLIVRKQ